VKPDPRPVAQTRPLAVATAEGMAKLRIPAVGIGLLLFIAAGLAGVLFIGVGNGSVGAAWALAVLLGVVVALTVVAVVRNNNTGRADEP